MNQKYPLIAAAVAAAISSLANAHTGGPSLASVVSNTNVSLVIAGSSAAKNSIALAIENDLCNGAYTTFTSTGQSKNFFAYSCQPTSSSSNSALGSLVNGSNIFTIYYRDEGGSVTGALPIASTAVTTSNPGGTSGLQQELRLLITAGTCNGGAYPDYTCPVTCTVTTTPSAVCGPVDSWANATTSDTVQLGVTDLEPAQLTGLDYPSGYSVAHFGSATTAQMQGLSHATFVDQVFGLFINTSSGNFNSTNLSRESYANILLGANPSTVGLTDWSQVPDALTGNPLTSSSQKIVRIDREPGSGTRTSANVYFLGYQCSSLNAIKDYSGEVDNYATGDELNAAEATAGAVAYASIDNWYSNLNSSSVQTLYTNMQLATLNGVTPTNLHAAGGAYDYWFEATTVTNSNTSVLSGNSAALASFVSNDMPQLRSVPQAADILAIPGEGATPNVAKVPVTSTATGSGFGTVYVNPYTRGGQSCFVPSEAL